MRILILGASGMLGNALYRFFSTSENYVTYGTCRSLSLSELLPAKLQQNLIQDINVENESSVTELLSRIRPNVVVNCVGLVKQLAEANDAIAAIKINALLPHQLARHCKQVNARLIHVSTDCVFSGAKGMYTEQDLPDAQDLYGRSKLLGEVDYDNAITLRTSIIGHEINSHHGLVDWFLSQTGEVKGYRKAVFSGLPTVELARVIRDFVIPNSTLHGTYHVSASPINKYELLKLVADVYNKSIAIVPDDNLTINRALTSARFKLATGYKPATWPELIRQMHAYR
ncbi:SDR family oxidoreductase [Alcaligenaceae bacterium LF4-65]|uniref:dTDP-4-dehydrorhamnose reductase n=1 Tax=Zwartia hollandica TaxID=324606 RepID=A0A953N7N7_9BURK|nr:SDR family oxidoreductase [Zwartia hollandica]